MSTTEIKKTRTPKNAESITKGALALPLQERVDQAEKIAKRS